MRKFLFLFLILSIAFFNFSCDDSPTSPEDDGDCDTCVVAYKPNIYIYPTSTINLSVKLEFPNGGKVLKSIPEYNNLWDISVEPNGRINNNYDFLFYECQMPNLLQKKSGWIVEQDKLKDFFEGNLSISGFNKNEIDDFLEYWLPKLREFNYYEIYPQYKSTIDKMVKVEFSNEPENFFRLFYYIKGNSTGSGQLLMPEVKIGKREDYFAVEWGVIK